MENYTAPNCTDSTPTTSYNFLLPILFAVVVATGVTGNTLVICVVRRRRSMHTTTNYLLLNVACCDIITLIWCPRLYDFLLENTHPAGRSGDWICKFFTHNAIMQISVLTSIFTLTIVSVERYHALVKPMQVGRRLTEDTVWYAVIASWTASLILTVPSFVAIKFDETRKACTGPFDFHTQENLSYMVIIFTVSGILPFLILFFCYFQIIRGLYFTRTICSETTGSRGSLKSKKAITKLLLSITTSFYVCYFSFGVALLYFKRKPKEEIAEKGEKYETFLKPFLFLLFFHSALNPILYVLQSSNFRQGFKQICCGKRNDVMQVTEASTAIPQKSQLQMRSKAVN
ncbi:tachykinin-like peptides receptor 86C [Nematostella vectensis]|uniref:tachykinin-like peptides receptor 86C n=1 Tax=Nematostella vectensis TaxID=45351 RepID=UPI002076EA5A|nr:tachykinin-like peptides receptor 86C [Nematostella vectensis]